jgi:hypothetical protein
LVHNFSRNRCANSASTTSDDYRLSKKALGSHEGEAPFARSVLALPYL